MKSRVPSPWQCGILPGLALLFSLPAHADDELRKQVHRDYGHRSYMLIEDAEGIHLYLFADVSSPSSFKHLELSEDAEATAAAIRGTRSEDPQIRVHALTQLAGVDSSEALDIALSLLSDPSSAVRDEARSLILDHPGGSAMVDALGLTDEDAEE